MNNYLPIEDQLAAAAGGTPIQVKPMKAADLFTPKGEPDLVPDLDPEAPAGFTSAKYVHGYRDAKAGRKAENMSADYYRGHEYGLLDVPVPHKRRPDLNPIVFAKADAEDPAPSPAPAKAEPFGPMVDPYETKTSMEAWTKLAELALKTPAAELETFDLAEATCELYARMMECIGCSLT